MELYLHSVSYSHVWPRPLAVLWLGIPAQCSTKDMVVMQSVTQSNVISSWNLYYIDVKIKGSIQYIWLGASCLPGLGWSLWRHSLWPWTGIALSVVGPSKVASSTPQVSLPNHVSVVIASVCVGVSVWIRVSACICVSVGLSVYVFVYDSVHVCGDGRVRVRVLVLYLVAVIVTFNLYQTIQTQLVVPYKVKKKKKKLRF